MPKCKICGKTLKNPNSQQHINSKYHQKFLKKEKEEKPDLVKEEVNIKNNNIAIFWDYENVRVIAEGLNVPIAEAIISFTESIGHPHIKRIYDNWAGINKTIIQALYSLGFEPIQVSMGKTNSVDVKIAVDCLDMALTHPSLTHFIIITGDKDFIPVVNWLRAHEKRVIVISKPQNVSEHLLMSADDFISLEELSKKYQIQIDQKEPKEKEKNITFRQATEILLKIIIDLREEGKSTRMGVLDNYMRSSKDFDYKGAGNVECPGNSGTFKTFTNFIEEVERAGKIKTETIGGFKEIFLIDEIPQEESEFSSYSSETIKIEHWIIICNIIIKVLKEAESKSKTIYKTKLLDELKKSRKQGTLLYVNQILREAIDSLLKIGFIIKKPNGKMLLNSDAEKNLNDYVRRAKN